MSSNLTKRDIILKIYREFDGTVAQNIVRDIVIGTIDALRDAVAAGQSIELRNFGVFEIQVRKERVGRNPNQPEIDPALRRDRIVVHGDVPSPIAPPPGCAFGHRTQCANYAKTVDMELKLMQVGADHWVMNCPCSCRPNGGECPPDVV